MKNLKLVNCKCFSNLLMNLRIILIPLQVKNFQDIINQNIFAINAKIPTYSFSSFFFVTFNLEKIIKDNNNISTLNIKPQFIILNNNFLIIKKKYLYKFYNLL